MFNPANLPAKIANIALDARRARKAAKQELEYDKMIAASQAKLAETTLVPGFTNVYA